MPLLNEQREYLESLDKSHIHGKNMLSKHSEAHVELFYEPYLNLLKTISGDIFTSVQALNDYKNFVAENSLFSAQSKFAPTIIEEYICQLLKSELKSEAHRRKFVAVTGKDGIPNP